MASAVEGDLARHEPGGAAVSELNAHHWVTMADPEGNEFCVT
jgi:hypothetical protein